AGPGCCSVVDTVRGAGDWREVYPAADQYLGEGADMVLAVAPYVDDESPVYVSRLGESDVRTVSDEPLAPPCVTGGVYGLSAGIRRAAGEMVARGGTKMRGFLKAQVADRSEERRVGKRGK